MTSNDTAKLDSDTRTVLERLPEILVAHARYLKGEDGATRADLRGADLRGADLRGADLRWAEGWIPISETDHGYLVAASWYGDHWQIQAGCRDFTIEEARAHWGDANYESPSSGSRIVHMLDWLEKQPTPTRDKTEGGGA